MARHDDDDDDDDDDDYCYKLLNIRFKTKFNTFKNFSTVELQYFLFELFVLDRKTWNYNCVKIICIKFQH